MANYSKGAGQKVEMTMHEMHKGKLKIGRSNKKVSNPKQAIAIGLSEAREKGAKVPKNAAPKKTAAKKASPKNTATKESATKKLASKKSPPKKAASKKIVSKKTAAKKST